MNNIKNIFLKFKPIHYYVKGRSFLNNPHYLECRMKDEAEMNKRPFRTDIINFILSQFERKTTYLEIGVRNPEDNFKKIKADTKYSVDPGLEFKANPVDFKLTSDDFFAQLDANEIQVANIKFDVIFIDGLHLAYQTDKDIENAFNYLKEDGFIVLHDCNPPTEWHTRYEYDYKFSPAFFNWSGTTWKAFLKWRRNSSIYSCCIDTDFGVGILSKKNPIGEFLDEKIEFFEYSELEKYRKKYLNLKSFDEFKSLFK